MKKGDERDFLLSSKAKRGLWKLMLKLPELRSKIQILVTQHETLAELCEAYEEASEMLSAIRLGRPINHALFEEYDSICTGIEQDLINYCK